MKKIPLVLALLCMASPGLMAQPAPLVPLYNWHSPSRGDLALSTFWTNPAVMNFPDYVSRRLEGRIFSPTAAAPPDTVPLYTWLSSSRGDYFATTDPAWTPPGSGSPDYTFIRTQGFVFNRPLAGTLALQSWWNPSLADNYATTDPTWIGTNGAAREGYTWYRTEGYIYPPPDALFPESPRQFHYGGLDIIAPVPPTRTLSGYRPALVFLLQYADQPMRHPHAHFDDWVFGPGYPNAQDYMIENSHGAFTWSRGGVIGPVTAVDDPLTTGNEALWRDNIDMTYTNFLYLGLTASNGNWVMVVNGGGAGTEVYANSTQYESWEQLALVDFNGPPLQHLDRVSFRTSEANFLRVVGTGLFGDGITTNDLATQFSLNLLVAGSVIRDGHPISIKSVGNGNYLQAVGGGGGGITVSSTTPGTTGRFTIRKTGRSVSHTFRQAVRRAVALGRFDPTPYDTDHDGFLSSDEATMAVVGSSPGDGDGGTNQRIVPFVVAGSSVRVAPVMAAYFGEGVSFNTMLHELTHQLGASDLYGGCCRSLGLTLMSCTGGDVPYNLDPWHRLRWGWAEPIIFSLRNPGGSGWLETLGDLDFRDKRPILLYDPARYDLANRVGEFFLLEYRTKSFNPASYDRGIPSEGLALWHVQNNALGGWDIIPSTCPGGGLDASVFTRSAPSGDRGGTQLWTAGHGTFGVQWLDGANAPMRLQVSPGSFSNSFISVEWSPTGILLPRLDNLSRSIAAPGQAITIDGMFPVYRSSTLADKVELVNGPARYTMSIRSWDASEILFDVPFGIPDGNYLLEVQNQSIAGNRLPVRIQNHPIGFVRFSSPAAAGVSNWMTLSWTSSTPRMVVIEATTNLVDWRPIHTNTPPGLGLSTFIDRESRRFRYRFYRILQ